MQQRMQVLRDMLRRRSLPIRFLFVVICALGTQFGIGAARSFVTASRWWVSGLEMLVLGALVAAVAYATGAGIASVVD